MTFSYVFLRIDCVLEGWEVRCELWGWSEGGNKSVLIFAQLFTYFECVSYYYEPRGAQTDR